MLNSLSAGLLPFGRFGRKALRTGTIDACGIEACGTAGKPALQGQSQTRQFLNGPELRPFLVVAQRESHARAPARPVRPMRWT